MTEDAIKACRDLYNIRRWGEGYFDISDAGRVIVYPTRPGTKTDDQGRFMRQWPGGGAPAGRFGFPFA